MLHREQTLEKSARAASSLASSLAWHIFTAPPMVCSDSLKSFSRSFLHCISDSQNCTIELESWGRWENCQMTHPVAVNANERRTFRKFRFLWKAVLAKFFIYLFFTTSSNWSLSSGWANTKVLNTSVASVPAMVSSMASFFSRLPFDPHRQPRCIAGIAVWKSPTRVHIPSQFQRTWRFDCVHLCVASSLTTLLVSCIVLVYTVRTLIGRSDRQSFYWTHFSTLCTSPNVTVSL